MVKIPEMYHHQFIFLIFLNFLLTAQGQAADKDVCSPCQIGKVKPSGTNIEPVTDSWRLHIQNIDGSKCYYPFENDDKSLLLQIKFINDELEYRSKFGGEDFSIDSSAIRKPADDLKVELVMKQAREGSARALYESRDPKEGGCNLFYKLYNDKAATALLGRPEFTDYTGEQDPGRRAYWKRIDDSLSSSPKLPILAVYSNKLEEYKDLYRDRESFCRYSTFSGPISKFGQCPEQYTCGLVDIPSLHPLTQNILSLVVTALRYVDNADRITHKYFSEEDTKTSAILGKALEEIVGADDWKELRNRAHLRMNLPCIHLHHEYRSLVKRSLEKLMKQIAAEKNTVNGLMRHFREILIIHLRIERPQLRGLLEDGTELQFRQIGENCGCSVPFWRTLSHMMEIITAPTRYDGDGFRYNFEGLEDIKDLSEMNFYKSALASCDFGLNLECSDMCKCICPNGAVCNSAPRSHQLFFSIIIYMILLIVLNKTL